MKNKLQLLSACILLTLLFVTEAKSEIIIQSEAGSELVMTEAAEEIPVYIPDARFLNRLIAEGVDVNADGLISYVEAEAVINLDLGIENACELSPDMITFLGGIEAFVNLEELNVNGNLLSRLDLSNSPNLQVLTCKMNMITQIDLSNNTMLKILDCSWNKLDELDITSNHYLEKLSCGHNLLRSVDLSKNLELSHLNTNTYSTPYMAVCAANRSRAAKCLPMDFLDVTNNTKLEYLMFCGAKYTELDLSNNMALKVVFCIQLNEDCEVKSWWCDSPPPDVEWIEVHCNTATVFKCPEVIDDKGTVLAVDRRLADQIQVFPNPAVDFITIETANNGVSHVNISSLNGKILFSEKFAGGSHSMDVSSYQKGMYLLTVSSGEMTVSRKIILR